MGLQKVERGRWPKKALLVMTDGMDNASSNSLNNTIDAARRAGVLIYTVGLGTVGGPGMALGPMMMAPMFGRHGMGLRGFGPPPGGWFTGRNPRARAQMDGKRLL